MSILNKSIYLYIILNSFFLSVSGITAKFNYTKVSNCSPTVVVFTNTSSSGSGITYVWNFGQGSEVTTQDNTSREQIYTQPGKYTVTLKVSNGSQTSTYSEVVTIGKGPSADFITNTLTGCNPLTVNFTSTSTQGDSAISKISWDFQDGNYASGITAKNIYHYAGRYGVVLKVTDTQGCTSTLESDSLLLVADAPVVSFLASDTTACNPPLNVTFSNHTTGASALTYLWDYGNGKTSTDYSNSCTYTNTGNFNVKLTATDIYGCSSSLTKKSYINIGSATGTLNVFDADSDLITTNQLCPGKYTFVFSNSTVSVCDWTIQDNSVIHTYSGTDTVIYTVKDTGSLTINLVFGNSESCTEIIKKVFKKNYVNASFSMDASLFCTLPRNINMVNSSNHATAYQWYIGNNLVSADINLAYTLTQENRETLSYAQLYNRDADSVGYKIKLIATSDAGCVDSVVKYVYQYLPVARFMPNKVSGCIPLLVSFADSSSSVYPITSRTYLLDGKTVTPNAAGDVNYTFTKAGIFEVKEIITSHGCMDTSQVVQIMTGEKLKPDFKVTPAEICNGGNLTITDKTSGSSNINNWKVHSGNLFSFTTSYKPDTTFSVSSDTTGYKDIQYQVNYNGCLADTTRKSVYKILGSAGYITQTFSCDTPLVYHFKTSVKPYTTNTWYIDTATYSNVDSVRFKFKKNGDYTIKLVTTDMNSGCSLTRYSLVKVRQIAALYTLSDTTYCVGDSVTVNSTSSKDYINSCYNEGFLWNFGDDSPLRRTYTTSFSHVYSAKGRYKILLISQAENGCIDSMSTYVNVHRPDVSFTVDTYEGCTPGFNVNFTNTSTDSTIVSSVWDFGDGVTDTTQTIKVKHSYSSENKTTWYAKLTATDAYQCFSDYSVPITINSLNADFQADDNAICLGTKITFTPVETSLDSLRWTFGDGTNSTTSNSHVYSNKGYFTVSLKASKDGCSNTVTKEKYISVEYADATFSTNDSILSCYPDTLTFIHLNTKGSDAANRTWMVNSNTLNTSSDSVVYTFTRPGNYNIKLYVKTINGCEASSSKSVSITGPYAYFKFRPEKICYNDSVKFTLDSISEVSQWKWLFGDGTTSAVNPVYHVYTSRGKLLPSVLLTGKNCTVNLVGDTLAVGLVNADFSLVDDGSLCKGDKVSFLNKSLYSDYWTWYVNNIPKTNDYNLTEVTLSNVGTNIIKLIATDSIHCSDTLEKSYTVYANPDFTITGDSILCKNQSSGSLSITKENGWSVLWSPAATVSSTSSFNITVNPSETTTYTARVSDSNGCYTALTKTIYVNELAAYSRIPLGDTSIIVGDKIMLSILSDATDLSYAWSPNYNISCTGCNPTYVSPTRDVTYQVEIKNTCVDFSEKFNIKVIYDFYLEAPTAFTPNGDANNDLFLFEENNIKSFELKIFNRWGQVVFSTSDITQGWDGTVNGHAQNTDTYTYYVKAETVNGYKFEKNGSFLLLK